MSFGVGVCMRSPCPPFVSKEGSWDHIYVLKEKAASFLLLGIGRALKVSSGFLLCGFAFWLSKPEKARPGKQKPQAGRGDGVTRAGPGSF